jgi:integrase
MNTNVLFVLDKRNGISPHGTYPIILRIIHNRKSTQITTGTEVRADDWDEKKREIKPSYKGTESVTRLNNYLRKKKTEALDIILKLDENKTLDRYTLQQLEHKATDQTFFSYAESLIKKMKEAKQIGNARTYEFTISVLKKFCKDKPITFHEINYNFLLDFEQDHLAKGNALNGLSVYLRTIRAIFNKAIKAGIVNQELYPFKNYSIKGSKTRKRAIGGDAIKAIEALKLEPGHSLFNARNLFLFSYYTRGMSFFDMAMFRKTDIIDGRICYQRQKTDIPYTLKIFPEIAAILSFYLTNQNKTDYVFPIIRRTELEDQYKDIEWARKRFNKKLRKIAELCDIDENITSYVSRHSFATRAKSLKIPVADIKDMLGHESIKTTEIYLDSLPSDVLDDLHERIIR